MKRNSVAVVGAAETTKLGVIPDLSVLGLLADAALNAIADAGLKPSDIDGIAEAGGYPPTLREIGSRMGIRSTNGVNDHLRALERKGYLTREDMKSRALRPTALNGETEALDEDDAGRLPSGSPSNDLSADDEDLVEIQVLGRVAAGLPLFAEEHVIDTVLIPTK